MRGRGYHRNRGKGGEARDERKSGEWLRGVEGESKKNRGEDKRGRVKGK